MKRFVFLSFLVCMGYLAGMYQAPSLMILAVLQLVLSFLLIAQAQYGSRHVYAGCSSKKGYLIKEHDGVCTFHMVKRTLLPIGGFQIKVSAHALLSKEESRKKWYGSFKGQEMEAELQIRASSCGLLCVRLESLRVYDTFMLFSGKRSLQEQFYVPVFPAKKPLRILLALSEEGATWEAPVAYQGDSRDEILQIREYRTGDAQQHIHWNMSARTGELLIKEYSKEEARTFRLLLDQKGWREASFLQKDCFYELLSSLLYGLLQESAVIEVFWEEKAEDVRHMNISEPAQCRSLLSALYQMEDTEIEQKKKTKRQKNREKPIVQKPEPQVSKAWKTLTNWHTCFKLNLHLEVFFQGNLLYAFSAENLEEELQHAVLVL